jgi:lipopolysaccharide transport system ATP-binding protein
MTEQAQQKTIEPALFAHAISKSFPVFHSPGHRLARALFGALVRPPTEFVALDNVSFEIAPGDALAVVGRNGAGKSTLLQILAGILEPTTGQLRVPGKVAGLLELGSGFNPEFTGRENIRINAAILGLGRHDVEERLDAIIEFASIGDFIDMPVKTYSSGMFMRLAFSVAIHVEPDLLLVDEALTVGDVFFQQKCYRRLADLRERGMSVLLVTHSMMDAAEFCNRGIVLSSGRMAFDGSGKEAVEYYFHYERETPTGRSAAASSPSLLPEIAYAETPTLYSMASAEVLDLSAINQFGDGSVRALRMLISDVFDRPRRVFAQGETLRVRVDYEFNVSVSLPLCGLQILNVKGALVHGKNSLQFENGGLQHVPAGMILHCFQEVTLDIDSGEYTLEIGLAELAAETFAIRHRLRPDEIAPQINRLCHVTNVAGISVINRTEGHPCLFSHYGVADLKGSQIMQIQRRQELASETD